MDQKLNLSRTIISVQNELSPYDSVYAADLVNSILKRHPEYGKGSRLSQNLTVVDVNIKNTKNVKTWLERVRSIYKYPKVEMLHGRNVIIGLCILNEELRNQLNSNGFLYALIKELKSPINDILTDEGMRLFNKMEVIEQRPVVFEFNDNQKQLIDRKKSYDLVGSFSDSPENHPSKDKLGRVAYARYLVKRILAVRTNNSFSMHIGGPWGSGKSTLLNFIKAEFKSDLKNQWVVIEFNAWQNQHINPPWWPLLDSVFEQSKSYLGFKAKFRENLWRMTLGKTLLQLGIFLISLTGLLAYSILYRESDNSGVTHFFTLAGAIIAAMLGLYSLVQGVSGIFTARSSRTAESYIETTTNPMVKISKKFNKLIERIENGKIKQAKLNQIKLENSKRTKRRKEGKNELELIKVEDIKTRVVIIIDDLDRCKTEFVVELLEGIQTLFNQKNVVFIVAADQRWLNACFEESYVKLKTHVKETGKGLGTLFLEKVFQFVAPIPAIPDNVNNAYWLDLLKFKDDEILKNTSFLREQAKKKVEMIDKESELLQNFEDNSDLSAVEKQYIREESVVRMAAPELVENIETHTLAPFAHLLNPNPRAMKRLVNAYSINRALATLGYLDISQNTLALWTILSMRWPSLARNLEANPQNINHIKEQTHESIEILEKLGLDPAISALFSNPDVIKIVNQNGLEIKLDAAVIEKCAMLRM